MIARMTPLDKLVVMVLALLAISLAALAWLGSPLGVQATLANLEQVGLSGPLVFEFSRPVQVAAVQNALDWQPWVDGRLESETPTRLRFYPDESLSSAVEYQVSLQAGALGVNGERLKSRQEWRLRVRPEQVLYLASDPQPREIWRVGLDGAAPVQLTFTEGRVEAYHAAPSGEQIVFSLFNQQFGVDLWLVGRDGQVARLLLNCGLDRCLAPAWSPDGRTIAFSRQAAPLTPGGQHGAPRPYLFSLATMQPEALLEDPQQLGYGLAWSPDGRRAAMWDGGRGEIRILDLQNGQEYFLRTQTGVVGSWSPDGQQMLYTRVDPVDEGGFRSVVGLYNLPSGQVETFLEGGTHDLNYSVPAWSPDGKWVVYSLRPDNASPARELRLRSVSDGREIVLEPLSTYTYSAFRWNAQGSALIYQRARLGGVLVNEVMRFVLGDDAPQVLVSGGAWPQWLP
jgi:Tol biopolymer transport system component